MPRPTIDRDRVLAKLERVKIRLEHRLESLTIPEFEDSLETPSLIIRYHNLSSAKREVLAGFIRRCSYITWVNRLPRNLIKRSLALINPILFTSVGTGLDSYRLIKISKAIYYATNNRPINEEQILYPADLDHAWGLRHDYHNFLVDRDGRNNIPCTGQHQAYSCSNCTNIQRQGLRSSSNNPIEQPDGHRGQHASDTCVSCYRYILQHQPTNPHNNETAILQEELEQLEDDHDELPAIERNERYLMLVTETIRDPFAPNITGISPGTSPRSTWATRSDGPARTSN